MNTKNPTIPSLLATMALFLAATTGFAQIVVLDFNDVSGNPSLVNRGSVPFTASFTNTDINGTSTPNYATSVPPPNNSLGRSAEFTGSTGTNPAGQVIDAGTLSALDNLKSLTFTGWFYNSGSTGTSQYLVDWRDGTAGFYVYRSDTGGILNAGTGASGTLGFGTSSAISPGEWAFVAVTLDLTTTANNFLLYVGSYDQGTDAYVLNSTAVQSVDQTDLGDSANTLFFGNAHSDKRTWAGNMDSLRIYGSTTDSSAALNSTQLQTIMQISDVPEPSVLSLFVLGIAVWAFAKRTRMRNGNGVA